MKLKILSNRFMKLSLPLLLVYILLSSSLPSSGIIYQLEEDFGSDAAWIIKGTDWSGYSNDPNQVVNAEPTAVIENGELVFDGEPDNYGLDGVYTNEQTVVGSWSFDVYLPSNAFPHFITTQRIWGIFFSYLPVGFDENETKYPQFSWEIKGDRVFFNSWDGDSTCEVNLEQGTNNITRDVYQHFDFIRSPSHFRLYIDMQLVANFEYSGLLGKNVNYFGFVAVKGSQVKIDNLKISTDYNGKLSELGEEIENNPISALHPNNNLNYVAIGIPTGIIIVMTISTGYTYHISRKRRQLKLIKQQFLSNYANTENAIHSAFDQHPEYFLSLLSNRKVREDLGIPEDEVISVLVSEIQEYKHLLNPIRLSVMQILFIDERASSIQIKEKLNISWSHYYNTISALERLNVITIIEDFDVDGAKRQFIGLKESGRKDYVRLIKLIDNFVENAKNYIPGYSKDFLYPNS